MVKLTTLVTEGLTKLLENGGPVTWMSEDKNQVILGPLNEENNLLFLMLLAGADTVGQARSIAEKGGVEAGDSKFAVLENVSNFFQEPRGALLLQARSS